MKKLLFAVFVTMSACTGNGQKSETVETDSVAVDTITCADTLSCICPEKDSIN